MGRSISPGSEGIIFESQSVANHMGLKLSHILAPRCHMPNEMSQLKGHNYKNNLAIETCDIYYLILLAPILSQSLSSNTLAEMC